MHLHLLLLLLHHRHLMLLSHVDLLEMLSLGES